MLRRSNAAPARTLAPCACERCAGICCGAWRPAASSRPGARCDEAIERVKLAESLGYESVVRDARRRARVADGADRLRAGDEQHPRRHGRRADLHAHAGDDGPDGRDDRRTLGRAPDLGLGVSHRPVVEGWHGQTIDKPVAEMREYASIVRAILRGEDPPRGEKWQTGFRLWASTRARSCRSTSPRSPPRCCASPARSPTACCCGCAARSYIRDVVIPEVSAGANAPA